MASRASSIIAVIIIVAGGIVGGIVGYDRSSAQVDASLAAYGQVVTHAQNSSDPLNVNNQVDLSTKESLYSTSVILAPAEKYTAAFFYVLGGLLAGLIVSLFAAGPAADVVTYRSRKARSRRLRNSLRHFD